MPKSRMVQFKAQLLRYAASLVQRMVHGNAGIASAPSGKLLQCDARRVNKSCGMWQREIKRCGVARRIVVLKLKCCLSFCRCQCGVCVILLAQCKRQLLLLLQLQLLPLAAAAATAVCNYEQSALITDTNNNGGSRKRERE